MAQALSWSQALIKQLQSSSLLRVQGQYLSSIPPSQLRRLSRWFMALLALIVMVAWNWKLVLATGAGIGSMLAVYLAPTWHWQKYWANLHRFLNGPHRQLALAVVSGGLVTLLTYMVTSIWVSTDNGWLAMGAIVQGIATLLTLLLLIWQIVSQYKLNREQTLDKLFDDLTQVNSLSRLIAVDRLTRLLYQGRIRQSHQLQVSQYLRLMLSQEEQTVIRKAILEALQILGELPTLEEANPSQQIPLHFKKQRHQVMINE